MSQELGPVVGSCERCGRGVHANRVAWAREPGSTLIHASGGCDGPVNFTPPGVAYLLARAEARARPAEGRIGQG